MLQIKTLITALTVICIASMCLAGLVTFMLCREAGRMLHHGKPAPMAGQTPHLIALSKRNQLP